MGQSRIASPGFAVFLAGLIIFSACGRSGSVVTKSSDEPTTTTTTNVPSITVVEATPVANESTNVTSAGESMPEFTGYNWDAGDQGNLTADGFNISLEDKLRFNVTIDNTLDFTSVEKLAPTTAGYVWLPQQPRVVDESSGRLSNGKIALAVILPVLFILLVFVGVMYVRKERSTYTAAQSVWGKERAAAQASSTPAAPQMGRRSGDSPRAGMSSEMELV